MRQSTMVKKSSNGFLTPVLFGIGGSLAVQFLGTVAAANLILGGVINEQALNTAAFIIRMIAAMTGALLTWYIANDQKVLCMIISCSATLTLWLVAALGFWGVDIVAFLIAAAICAGIYGAAIMFLPMLRSKRKWGHGKKRYR